MARTRSLPVNRSLAPLDGSSLPDKRTSCLPWRTRGPTVMRAYRCKWVKTPASHRGTRDSVPRVPPCFGAAPSRACILTGRNPWQLKRLPITSASPSRVKPMPGSANTVTSWA